MVVGVIWIVQGLGVLDTGSFMDRQPVWAIAGAVLSLGGLATTLVQRRRRRARNPDQPGS